MRNTMKFFALVLTLVLTFGVLTGCGGSKTVKEKGKYTYWVTMSGSSSQTLEKYDDMFMYQELEKRTGIDVDFIHPSKGSTGNEAFQILLTSSDMPDMVEYSWKSYPGGPDAAIDNKVIISLNEYMKEAAPNYYAYMEGEKAADNGKLYKVQSITEKGNYYGFQNLNFGTYRGFSGLYIRKDLLDKWGLEVPVTIDDWTEVFKVAKENGIKKPLTGGSGLFAITGSELFNIAWDVAKDYYIMDGKIKFGPAEAKYKEYIAQMADWYKNGYIDPDFITNDSNVIQGNMTNGTSIATSGYVGSGMGVLLPAMEEKDPNYSLVACPHPVLKEGNVSLFQEVQPESNDPAIAITYQCGKDDAERYKEAMTWCDYLYSDEGIILKSFGVKGVTYNEEVQADGSVKYKYIISSPEEQEKIGAHSVEAALYHYLRPANSPGFNQHSDYLEGFYPYEQQKEALKIWNTHVEEAKKHVMPTMSYTDEEATKTAEINTKIREKFNADIMDIIRNEISIDKYDSIVDKAMKDGFDELVSIHQAAYDRYLANLK